MTALISIETLCKAAEGRGFKVRRGNSGSYAELFAPEHKGPEAVWNFDSQYSTCDFVLCSRPTGYGYNPFFFGPWHPGLVQHQDAERLLAHPAMAGALTSH